MTANSAVAEVMRPPGSAEPTDEAPVLLEFHDRRQRSLHHLGLGTRAEGLLGTANKVSVDAERHLEFGHGGSLPHRLYHTQDIGVLRAAGLSSLLGLGDALDPARHGGERVVELGGILAAGLGEIGAPPAAAADELGHFLDELAGLKTLGEVLGNRGDEVDLAVHDG